MPVNLQTFTDFAAQHTVRVSKNIHVHEADGQMEVGSASFKQTLGRDLKANQRTMAAFRNCLSERYGVFGEHAFDAVLGARADVGKTLRAKDIASVMRALSPTDTGAVRQTMIAARFANEASRQAETNPRAVAANVTGALKERLQACFEDDVIFARAVRGCENQAELSRLIEGKINAILDMNELPGARRTLAVDAAPAPAPAADHPQVPTGLQALDGDTFGGAETSVEDRVRTGAFGAGMRVNESGVKYVFEKLKTSGVEPGFIVRKDWTAADTQTMMTDGTDLDQVARDVLEQRLGRPLTAQDDVRALKAQHFVAIRDAAMAGVGNVRRLTERHIVKLDYNENDRRVRHDAAHIGHFRLPVRNAIKGGAFKGAFFRAFRLTTANEASAGAVAEALANDLTRAMGVPTQELSLVKGRYSDGHEKLMLVSKFAHGYRDFDGNFLKDGRLVGRQDAHGNVIEQPEDIGRYKAMFLLLADRDAVGSHGQNKGIVNGHFFAIDPGHSLEGNGAALEIHDDFSFKDTQGGVFEKRFLNFSVFDDSNRSEKLKGMVAIRDAFVHGDFDNIFNEYEARFPADDPHADQALSQAIQTRIREMRAEFNGQYDRMMGVFGGQLAVYDHFLALTPGDDATACRVIDAVENLERLTSPTVSTSKHGEVQLRHLEVTPETRVPWKVRVAPDGAVVYSCDRLPEGRKPLLENMLQGAGVTEVEAGTDGSFTFTVPQANLPAFLGAFTEDAVRQAVGG